MPTYADPVEAMEASDEGIIAKLSSASYSFCRTSCWIKAKWQYHRDGSSVDWLHDEIDWKEVEAGHVEVSRTLDRLYA